MEMQKRSRYKKPAVAIAIVAVIVGLLWAGGQYQLALVVLSISSLALIVASMLAIATLREQVSENEFAALHDPLTELPNRLLFHDRVRQAILAARRTGTRSAVMLLDVDHFKEINDSLGHQTGDLALFEIARRLADTLRVSDTVARLGGDEFAVLLPRGRRRSFRRRRGRARCARRWPRRSSVDDLDVEMAPPPASPSTRPRRGPGAAAPTRRGGDVQRQGSPTRATSCTRRPGTSRSPQPPAPRGRAAQRRSRTASSSCTTSPRSGSATAASSASRRSCAGSHPSAGCSPPTSSSRSPSTPA